MKKLVSVVALVAVVAGGVPAITMAQGNEPDSQVAKKSESASQMQLAKLLVQKMGLYRYLPDFPTNLDMITTLVRFGVEPKGGWVVAEPLTVGVMAQTIVQAMGLDSEVENPSDPASWIAVLQANGVEMKSVSTATSDIRPVEGAKADVRGAKINYDTPVNLDVVNYTLREVPVQQPPRTPATPN